MRTKALLIAAAAFAAGIISSNAQVYSQNIVGYVNQVVPNGYIAQANPLNNAAGNALTNLIPNTGQWDGAYVLTWTGHGYATYTLDSSMPTGVADAGDSYPTNAPIINPGTGFILDNGLGVTLTNTYVGTVAISSYPGTTTNTIPGTALYSLVGSVLPIGGGISSVLGLTNNAGALDGDYILVPNIVNGVFHGYKTTTIDSGMSTGFADAGDSYATNEPVIPVASSFFFNNAVGSTVTWIQSLGQ